jgi:hypothetical protein
LLFEGLLPSAAALPIRHPKQRCCNHS